MEGEDPPAGPAVPRRSGRRLARRIALAVLAAAAAGAVFFFATLPDVTPLRHEMPRTTAFMERRKRDLERQGLSSTLEWRPVPMGRIAPSLQRAVVVAEDARFWKHEGVDWQAVRRALEEDLEEGGARRGASTITQQLAKNLYLSPSRSPWRKLREWAIARRLERELTKRRILELYLNVIEFGQRTYGAEAAARRYFRKPASRLTPRESATLAAVIPSPRVYDPVRHPGRVARRASRILRWMGTWRRFPAISTPTRAPASEPTLAPIPVLGSEAPAVPPVSEPAAPSAAQTEPALETPEVTPGAPPSRTGAHSGILKQQTH